MTKNTLIAEIARRSSLTQDQVEESLDHLASVVKESITAGDPVYMKGFLTFELKKRAAKSARNPRTGEKITIPPHAALVIKPGKEWAKSVRQQTAE